MMPIRRLSLTTLAALFITLATAAPIGADHASIRPECWQPGGRPACCQCIPAASHIHNPTRV